MYWPHIFEDTRLYVATCEKRQRSKGSQDRPVGLLQPLPIPSQRWEVVTMDSVGPLPSAARNFNAIAVFVDKLTKLAHFIPCTIAATAADAAPPVFF